MTECQYLCVHAPEPEFYAKNSCCLLLAGNCLESYRTYCVCIRARSSVLSVHGSHESAQDESVVTGNYLTCWNKGKRSKQTLISGPSPVSGCIVSHLRLSQRGLPSGLGLQLNRLNWRNHVRTAWAVFICLQRSSVSDRVCLCVWFQ